MENGIIIALIILQALQFILFGILFGIQSDKNNEIKKRIKVLEETKM